MGNYSIGVRFYILSANDPRALSIVWIKPQFKIIEDLINHIESAFGVKNFILHTRGCYLSPREDIGIIRPDDQILVLPNTPTLPLPVLPNEVSKKKRKLAATDTCIIDNSEDTTPSKKAKFEPLATSSTSKTHIVESRIQHFNNLSSNSNESTDGNSNDKVLNLPPDDLEQIQQNKKKVLQQLESQLSSEELITPQPGSKKPKKKKRKISNSELDNQQNSGKTEPNESSKNLVMTNKRVSQLKSTNTPDNCNNLSKNPKLIQHVTPSRNILPTTVLLKRVNVINNIVVKSPCKTSAHQAVLEETIENKYNNQDAKVSSPAEHALQNNTKEKNEEPVDIPVLASTSGASLEYEEASPSTNKNSLDMAVKAFTTNLMTTIIEETPARQTIDECSPDASIFQSSDGDSTVNKFVTRRKRVRVRKRKTKASVHQDTPMVQKYLSLPFKLPNIETKPLIHKYFPEIMDEDATPTPAKADDSNQHEHDVTLNGVIHATTEDISSVDLITAEVPEVPEEKPLNTPIAESSKDSATPIKLNGNGLSVLGKPLPNEVIDKLLPMKNQFPNSNDMIVFQMIKLSEGFTPEISKLIIGKVVAFDSNTKEVQLYIMDGLSEFEQPQGTLLNMFDENDTETTELQVLEWTNLINPRLLGP